MTVSIKQKIARASKARDKASSAIFAFAPDNRTRFLDCYKLATQEAREAYDNSCRALDDAEQAAIDAGKAYRASFGMLTFYR